MSAMSSQITGVLIICSTICLCACGRKHQSSSSLVFVREIPRWPVDSPDKGPVTRKMFPFDDVIMMANDVVRSGISPLFIFCHITLTFWLIQHQACLYQTFSFFSKSTIRYMCWRERVPWIHLAETSILFSACLSETLTNYGHWTPSHMLVADTECFATNTLWWCDQWQKYMSKSLQLFVTFQVWM